MSAPAYEGPLPHPLPPRPRPPTAQQYFLYPHADDPKPMHDPPDSLCLSPPVSSASSSHSPSPDFAQSALDHLPHSPSTLSSLSLDEYDNGNEGEDDLLLPSYDTNQPRKEEKVIETPKAQTPEPPRKCSIPAADDTSVETEPDRHVDYLSHEWREEDIWSSWRYTVSRRNAYSNGVRLENASWRTWAKYRLKLSTVSPETLNW